MEELESLRVASKGFYDAFIQNDLDGMSRFVPYNDRDQLFIPFFNLKKVYSDYEIVLTTSVANGDGKAALIIIRANQERQTGTPIYRSHVWFLTGKGWRVLDAGMVNLLVCTPGEDTISPNLVDAIPPELIESRIDHEKAVFQVIQDKLRERLQREKDRNSQ